MRLLKLTRFITSDRLSGRRAGAGCYAVRPSYNTLACVNNIGVQLSVELNGDGRVQRDPGVRPPTALLPG